jgi:hypothetical protein
MVSDTENRSVWSLLRRFVGSAAGALLGGMLFAAWAAFANRDGGAYVSLRSSLGQCFVSATLTFIDARLMNRIFRFAGGDRAGAVCAVVASLVLTYTLVIGVHMALHTPHILLTVLPGMPPTVGFSLMYATLLLREQLATATPSTIEDPACIQEI